MRAWKRGLPVLRTPQTQRRGLAQVRDVKIEVVRVQRIPEERRVERNVLNRPLTHHSSSPVTGFTRTGYCSCPPQDIGNHSIAVILTEQFLNFSAARGNDLRAIGLKGGSKWCLCASRWLEAYEAWERGGLGDSEGGRGLVPRVDLDATNERALEEVELGMLEKFAIDKGEKGGDRGEE